MILASLLAAAASPAFVQRALQARRADIEVEIPLRGRAVPDETLRVLAPIAGRVEQVVASSGAWVRGRETLAFMVDREFAAIIDARGSFGLDFLQERWRRVYKPHAVQAPAGTAFYILKTLAAPRETVKARAPLFEATRALQIEVGLGARERAWLEEAHPVELWTSADPARRYRSRLKGLAAKPGAEGLYAFAAEIPAEAGASPGEPWEGVLRAKARRGVVAVPTQALWTHDGTAYLRVKVSTGMATPELTEIRAGLEAGEIFLAPEASAADRALTRGSAASEVRRETAVLAPASGRAASEARQEAAADDPYAE